MRPRIFYNCTIFIAQRMAIFEVNLLSIVLSSSAGVGPARHLRLSHDLCVASSHSPWVLHPVCCCCRLCHRYRHDCRPGFLPSCSGPYPCCCSVGVSSGFIHLILKFIPHPWSLIPRHFSYTLSLLYEILNPHPSSLNHQSSSSNLKPQTSTLNPPPFNPKPTTFLNLIPYP